MAIYTKKGDKGETGTFNGKRISKSSRLIRLIGTIDELNSFLGIIGGLTDIQGDLFTISSILSGGKLRFTKAKTKKLEKQIDKWEKILPVQKNFIYYGGSKESSLIFFARALARRAERSLVSFTKKEKISEAILIYFNRLSDYLFVLGRLINYKEGVKESFWKTSK
jgi:cob(I)alamin adenosyltransferase